MSRPFSLFFFLFMVVPAAYGSSQARGQTRNAAAVLTPQPQQLWIQATYVTYVAACSNTRSLTHWARPGIEPTSSQRQCLNPLGHKGESFLGTSYSNCRKLKTKKILKEAREKKSLTGEQGQELYLISCQMPWEYSEVF